MHGWAEIKRVLLLPQPGFLSKKDGPSHSLTRFFLLLIYMYINSPFLTEISIIPPLFPRHFIGWGVQGAGWPSSLLTKSCLECSRKSHERLFFPGRWNSLKVTGAISLLCIFFKNFYFFYLFLGKFLPRAVFSWGATVKIKGHTHSLFYCPSQALNQTY